MADEWDAFPDAADDSDPWAAFPDAEPAKASRPKRNGKFKLPRYDADKIDVRGVPIPPVAGAVDGDTLRTNGGPNVRLWGVDAPELSQPGYNALGQPVPVGQQSRNALLEIMGGGNALAGPVVSQSFGRPVAPYAIDGADVGQQMLRNGNALAAPDFLSSDPARRFDYMQAERLARQNQIGPVHDNFVEDPASYRSEVRANPDYFTPRETVAQFWDTPSQRVGLSAEVENGYLAIAKAGTAAEILAYGDANGFKLDPAATAAFVKARDAGADVDYVATYAPEIPVLTDNGDGATGAAVRGGGQGFLAGGLDEAGAVVDTLGLTPGRENLFNSDRRLADVWANNQGQNASILGYDAEFHPYARGAGEVVGALTSGIVIPWGAGARTVPQLARVGGAWGAAEGFLGTDGGIGERATGAAIGVPVGAVLGAGLGKAIEYGAPVIGKGVNAVFGRGAKGAAESTGEIVEGRAQQAAQDEWADFPDAVGDNSASTTGSRVSQSPRDVGSVVPGRPIISQTIGMEGDSLPSLSTIVRRPDYIDLAPASRPVRMDQPLTDAQRAALSQDIRPQDVLPMPANTVESVEEAAAIDAGRFAVAKAPNERGALESRTVHNWMGQPVPKVGPVDLVGFVRLRGGLNDLGDDLGRGGNLKAMGLTNASRKGMDFVGQEHRFGPLLNGEGGMSLDEAALQAWEAGYFPDHAERPSVNEFLDPLGETYNGAGGRRFHPDDWDEIDRFYGMQSDRYELEQAQHDAGGKVFVDRSEPADDPAPFPPVEAYDDRLAETAKRAGNIDLTKLDTPQDIRRALVQTEQAVGFDAATRGRVTQAETEALAADLGMTADKLLSRRKGQAFNAEEALAARQLLAKSGNELVNAARAIQRLDHPGDELMADFRRKWIRHVAIQEQVAGMTAEAGRALQQFRQLADSREVPGDVLSSIVLGGGGDKRLQDAAELLLDAVESGPGVFNTLAEKAAKPKWRDKIAEWYVNALLGWPTTHIVNVTSNTLTSIAQIPEYAAGAVIGGARQALSRSAVDRVTATEVGARAFGLLQGAKEGARLFAQALRTGEGSDFGTKVEGQAYKAIGGKLGEVVRIPTRFLTAEDELFKGVARRMELNGQAVRIARKEGLRGEARKARITELVADPTDEMFQRALDYGRYLTFQQKLGPFAQKVSALASENLPLKFLLPFVRTPTNLMKFATERSPAAPLLREWRKDFRAGGEARDVAIARALVGTGFGLAMYQAAASGTITGSAPSDAKKARLLYADGWKPYSIKIDGTYYSYKRLDPFSTTIGVAADLATLPSGMSDKQREDKATLLVASIMGNLASKTWLSGASSFIEAITEPERYAGDFKNRLVASFLIPNVFRGAASALDPTARKVETFGDEIRLRIPGVKDDLVPRRDIWGREIRNEGGLGPDVFSPMWTSRELADPVNHELLQIDYAPTQAPRKVGGRELTPKEHDRYQETSGKAAHAELSRLVTSREWKTLDDDDKVKAARKVVADARRDARDALFGDGKGDPDPWADFDDAPDPWAGFEDAPSRDVVGELESAIPGVRFTSGFRDVAYNQSLKARGYQAADNSEHLDGSALDMLPPPGKSLAWLRQQVARYDPKARLLIHDGHLHAGFNRFYEAPVFGGAKAAGVTNPHGGQ